MAGSSPEAFPPAERYFSETPAANAAAWEQEGGSPRASRIYGLIFQLFCAIVEAVNLLIVTLTGAPCPLSHTVGPLGGEILDSRDLDTITGAGLDSGGYTYRKLLRIDRDQDRCDVLKSGPEGWQPGNGPLTQQLEQFARSGAVHPEDTERFVSFTRLEHLRDASRSGREGVSLLYRRQTAAGCRWNLMEIIPDQLGGGEGSSAILCVKDIHDALWESLSREEIGIRGQELIRSLGEQDFNIYTINLITGTADPIRVDGQMRGGATPLALPWKQLMRLHIKDHLLDSYQDAFERRFSLEGLRQTWADGLRKTEMLCQWRRGEGYRYISITAHFSREERARNYAVLALQDVDERMRRELAHTKRDAQLAAILKSRFRTLNAVNLESGQCELLDLTRTAGPENTRLEDYRFYTQTELDSFVHPEDREDYLAVLSLDHLREKAAATEDFGEEVCHYRQQGRETRWMEQRVIYSRQKGQVMVNILGQDVTRQHQQEESRRQTLEDRAYIISSLSSLFFSTYYIDLDHDSFRAVIQLRRVEDVLGEEVNCTAALRIYANHFIHPEDRAEYLRVMSIDNLRQSLRWWQPCAAVEYRKLSDDPSAGPGQCDWVRATAVLAQTGPDDMPKTVVYVAQDITSNRHREETGR